MPLHGHCEHIHFAQCKLREAIPPFQIAQPALSAAEGVTSFTRNDTLLSASVLVRGSQRLCVNCGQLLTEAVISPMIGPSIRDRDYRRILPSFRGGGEGGGDEDTSRTASGDIAWC